MKNANLKTENYAEHYENLNQVTATSYPKQFKVYHAELAQLLPEDKSKIIVDLGCGVGYLVNYLQKQGYQNITGVDRSAGQLDVAKRYCSSAIHFEVEDAGVFLEGNKERFDCIFLFDLLEHIPKEQMLSFLDKAYHALRPSGQLIVRTPNMANILASYSRYIDFTHEVGFTEHSLRQVFFSTLFKKNIRFFVLQYSGSLKYRILKKIYHAICKMIYMLDGRTLPTTFEKNIIVVAEKR